MEKIHQHTALRNVSQLTPVQHEKEKNIEERFFQFICFFKIILKVLEQFVSRGFRDENSELYDGFLKCLVVWLLNVFKNIFFCIQSEEV